MRRSYPVPFAHSLATALLCLLLTGGQARATAFTDPVDDARFLPAGPSVTAGAAGAWLNPAAWAVGERTASAFWWDDQDIDDGGIENWGFSVGRRLGLAVQHRTLLLDGSVAGVTDWQLGLAGGGRGHWGGLALRWSSGATGRAGRHRSLVLGHILRPGRSLALGISGVTSLQSDERAVLLDAGLRPFGRPWLTLVGDCSLRQDQRWDDAAWSAGVLLEPVAGLQVGVRYRDDGPRESLAFAVGLTVGRNGLTVLPRTDTDGDIQRTAWLWRTDSPERSLPSAAIPAPLRPRRRLVELDLQDRILTYQKYRWFDDRRIAWLDLSRALDAVAADPEVAAVAVDLSGFRGRPSLIWELRRRLADLRRRGKEVVVQIDRGGMLLYDLASVADRLSLDPQGDLTLPGYDLSRTYLKGMLEKLGLGFQALQFFPHKTAVEVLSRDDMSAADREQRQRILDVIYERIRDDVCSDRHLSPARFDSIVDEVVMVLPEQALALGLVDTLARWDDLVRATAARLGAARGRIDLSAGRTAPNGRWGTRPRIAVVYAVGECAMEEGIRGRRTAAHLRSLARDPDVRAVVLRVDSPGGDPLPSDLVAAAVAELRRAGKPVVVSQGDVAASGGYWLSMNGTEILTTPLTVTGSIGVISGWLWDESLHERVGARADGVSRGRHADLFRMVRYPAGIDIPARPLSEEEFAKARERILSLYDGFVERVAAGRSLPPDSVRAVAGGRVWMGPDALRLGLCDRIGGLDDAVARARELAGLPADEQIVLVEYPPRPLLELPRLRVPFLGIALTAPRVAGNRPAEVPPRAADAELITALAAMRGRAWLRLLPDVLPGPWQDPASVP